MSRIFRLNRPGRSKRLFFLRLKRVAIKQVAIKGVLDCFVKLVKSSSIMSDSQFLPLPSFLFFRNFWFSPFILIFESPTQKISNLRFDGVHHLTRILKTFQVIQHIVTKAILTNQITGYSKN